LNIFYRFELAFDGQPQGVGFLQGLKDTGLPKPITDDIYHEFDFLPAQMLEYPGLLVFFFTEAGLDRFGAVLDRIISELDEINWQLLCYTMEDDLANAVYCDAWQAAFDREYLNTSTDGDPVSSVAEIRRERAPQLCEENSSLDQNHPEPMGEIRNVTDVVIVVEGGRVTDVYASKGSEVLVEVIDQDTQDPEEQDEIDERLKCLEAETAAGQMIPVY